jgi:hypothetical protein
MTTVPTEPHCYSTALPHGPRRKWGSNCDRRVFSTQNNPVLPLSVSTTFSLRYNHAVAPYILFLVFMPFPSFLQQRHLQGSSYATCDQSSYPSFVVLHVGCPFPFWLCNTFFLTWYGHLISIHLQDHISNLYPKYQKKIPVLLIRWTAKPNEHKARVQTKVTMQIIDTINWLLIAS